MTCQETENDHQIGFADMDDYDRMRDVLVAARYTDEGVLEATGRVAWETVPERQVPSLLRKISGDSPIEILSRLFLVGVPVDTESIQSAFSSKSLASWLEAGIVTERYHQMVATMRLISFKGRWLAFDRPLVTFRKSATESDFVMGLGTSTLTLANLAVRRPCANSLDLGSGNAVHAILAADHSDRVFAIDCNSRATSYGTFNVKLNGLDNVRCITGNLFDPVEATRFGLIISNPPFVISPSQRYVFRDSGVRGDEFCRNLAQSIPAYLEDGGYCQFLCEWGHGHQKKGQDRLSAWFSDCGCDVWVMCGETREVSEYATNWIGSTEPDSAGEFAAMFDRWMRYYEHEGIEEITTGVVMMRKAESHHNWFKVDDAPKRMVGACGSDVERVFALREFLETHPKDVDLLEISFHIDSAVRLSQQFSADRGSWMGEEAQMYRLKGLTYKGCVDPYFAGLVSRCDGRRSLRHLIEELARVTGQEVHGIVQQVVPMVRTLVEQSFLIPGKMENL